MSIILPEIAYFGGGYSQERTTSSFTLDTDSDSGGNYSSRSLTPAGGITFGGDQVRVSVTTYTAGASTISNYSIGKWTGADFDTAATPVELKTGGASGWSKAANTTFFSDWADLITAPGDRLVFIVDDNHLRRFSSSGTFTQKTGVTSYNLTSVTGLGYSGGTGFFFLNSIQTRYKQ